MRRTPSSLVGLGESKRGRKSGSVEADENLRTAEIREEFRSEFQEKRRWNVQLIWIVQMSEQVDLQTPGITERDYEESEKAIISRILRV
jgi:hypothetical protein